MGNRANLVIVENGDWTLHYAHWAGCRMLDVLAFGPEHAVQYIRAHEARPDLGWTDPDWADGGAIVDLDRRRVLFFGEELAASMPERRAMFDVLNLMWPEYSIGWAYGGTDELVDYLGADRDRDWDLGRPGMKLERVGHSSGLCHLVSVRNAEGELRMWQLKWGYSAAWQGPAMLNTLPYKGVKQLRRTMIPESGVHVDVEKRTVGVWTTWEARGLFDLMPERWPGWHTECWQDRYEEQVRRCDRALRVPSLNLIEGIATLRHWLHQRVFQACEDSPPGAGRCWSKTHDPARLRRDWDDYDDYDCYVVDSPFRPNRDDWYRFKTACEDQQALYTKSA